MHARTIGIPCDAPDAVMARARVMPTVRPDRDASRRRVEARASRRDVGMMMLTRGGAGAAAWMMTTTTRPDLGRAASMTEDDARVVIVADAPGNGDVTVSGRSLALAHVTGETTRADGSRVTFESTLGGAPTVKNYSGQGVSASIGNAPSRPIVLDLRAGSARAPGTTEGLLRGAIGMRAGGTRTFEVPPELGFGSMDVRGPLGVMIPANSTVRYTVTMLRVSDAGPDALMRGVSRCGVGGASAMDAGCARI